MSKWLRRFIPLIGYVEELERELERVRTERNAYLDRLLLLTTGLGLDPKVKPELKDTPQPESQEEPSIVDQIVEAEQKAWVAGLERFSGMTPQQYREWVSSGTVPEPEPEPVVAEA